MGPGLSIGLRDLCAVRVHRRCAQESAGSTTTSLGLERAAYLMRYPTLARSGIGPAASTIPVKSSAGSPAAAELRPRLARRRVHAIWRHGARCEVGRGIIRSLSTFGRWRSRLVAGTDEDRLSGVLRGDGVVAAEEVELAVAAVDVADEGAGGAEGRCSIGHRGGLVVAGLMSGGCGSARSFRVRRRSWRELGLVDSLVGVSEECRWPPEVVGKPVVTAARIDPVEHVESRDRRGRPLVGG